MSYRASNAQGLGALDVGTVITDAELKHHSCRRQLSGLHSIFFAVIAVGSLLCEASLSGGASDERCPWVVPLEAGCRPIATTLLINTAGVEAWFDLAAHAIVALGKGDRAIRCDRSTPSKDTIPPKLKLCRVISTANGSYLDAPKRVAVVYGIPRTSSADLGSVHSTHLSTVEQPQGGTTVLSVAALGLRSLVTGARTTHPCGITTPLSACCQASVDFKFKPVTVCAAGCGAPSMINAQTLHACAGRCMAKSPRCPVLRARYSTGHPRLGTSVSVNASLPVDMRACIMLIPRWLRRGLTTSDSSIR